MSLDSEPLSPSDLPARSAELLDELRSWLPRWAPLAAAGLVALAVGASLLLRPRPDAPELRIPMAAPAVAPTTTAPAVIVHVAGAVHRPGIIRLEGGARLSDAVAAAGGPLAAADLDRVNLAAPLTDGAHYYLPLIGEAGTVVLDAVNAPGTPGGLVDLNRAGPAELETLTGIGPALADAIVKHRDRSGPFAQVDDLLAVSGIGPAKLERIRVEVTVG
ncbi:MAG: ComEA family DNA-binding protein [Actinomycetia bacterium]|nr:ComEA family DNA-binding protein [Actinomycetes bacterium]